VSREPPLRRATHWGEVGEAAHNFADEHFGFRLVKALTETDGLTVVIEGYRRTTNADGEPPENYPMHSHVTDLTTLVRPTPAYPQDLLSEGEGVLIEGNKFDAGQLPGKNGTDKGACCRPSGEPERQEGGWRRLPRHQGAESQCEASQGFPHDPGREPKPKKKQLKPQPFGGNANVQPVRLFVNR